jgi:hypothetical protein
VTPLTFPSAVSQKHEKILTKASRVATKYRNLSRTRERFEQSCGERENTINPAVDVHRWSLKIC